ncbi:32815_t:CDS:2, partial [Racocetra persica]
HLCKSGVSTGITCGYVISTYARLVEIDNGVSFMVMTRDMVSKVGAISTSGDKYAAAVSAAGILER